MRVIKSEGLPCFACYGELERPPKVSTRFTNNQAWSVLVHPPNQRYLARREIVTADC
jgi:hypothetical protein